MNWVPVDPTQNTGIVLVDGLNLNGGIENDADIQTQLNVFQADGSTTGKVGITQAFICFTPLGRTYFTTNANVNFDGALPIVTPLEFRVQRLVGGIPVGTIRSVLLPPNGMARVFSHT